jgi:hypothetical protein
MNCELSALVLAVYNAVGKSYLGRCTRSSLWKTCCRTVVSVAVSMDGG